MNYMQKEYLCFHIMRVKLGSFHFLFGTSISSHKNILTGLNGNSKSVGFVSWDVMVTCPVLGFNLSPPPPTPFQSFQDNV